MPATNPPPPTHTLTRYDTRVAAQMAFPPASCPVTILLILPAKVLDPLFDFSNFPMGSLLEPLARFCR